MRGAAVAAWVRPGENLARRLAELLNLRLSSRAAVRVSDALDVYGAVVREVIEEVVRLLRGRAALL